MADPRGCEYREISVVLGSVWGEHNVVETHGWVLPNDQDQSPRFAVCWNGWVYPVHKLGPAAKLGGDFPQPAKSLRRGRAIFEHQAVNHQSTLHLRCCFLLRLGEVDLAEKFWQPVPSDEPNGQNPAIDP